LDIKILIEEVGNIFNVGNKALREYLRLHPVIILIILFCALKTSTLYGDFSKNIIPRFIIE